MLFALISISKLIGPTDLWAMRDALERSGAHCAWDWGLAAPAVDVFSDADSIPPRLDVQPVVFLDDEADPGALAVHFFDNVRMQPAARVYVPRASGMLTGTESVSELASHEILEALCDPRCDLWTDCPGRDKGAQIATEVADPTQASYVIDGVQVSDYVLPSYFDTRLADPDKCRAFLAAGGKFNRLGTMTRPGEIHGPEGYAILRIHDDAQPSRYRTWFEGPDGKAMAAKKPGAMHPWARSMRRQSA